MGVDANPVSRMSGRECSGPGDGVRGGIGIGLDFPTAELWTTGTVRVAGRFVLEPRGLEMGVRRGEGLCSSSSNMGGERTH